MPPLQSHTHRQAAQVNATTQAWQRVCLSQRTDENKHDCTTLYKRNAGFIAKFNISSSNKNSCKMKVSSLKIRTTLILDRQTVSKLNKFVENSLHSL